jgi:hypothetical protein
VSDFTDDVNGHAFDLDQTAVVTDMIMQSMSIGVNHMVKRLHEERGIGVSYFEVVAATLAYLYALSEKALAAQTFEDFEIGRLHLIKLREVVPAAVRKLTPTEEQLAELKGLKAQ